MASQIPNYRLQTNTSMPYESNYLDYGGTPVNPSAGGANMASQGGGALAGAGMMTGNPWVAGAGLALQGAGTLFDMFGGYEASEKAEDKEKQARADMERQLAIQAEERKKRDDLQYISSMFNFADYGQKTDATRLDNYGDYYRKVGV